VALAAWTRREENLWSSAGVAALVARGHMPEPPGDAPGQFAWAGEGVVADHLDAAGFADVHVDTLAFTMRFASVAGWWASQRALGVPVADAAARLSAGEEADVLSALERAAAPYTAADESLAIPARTWVAAATA
jgi:hypothetical protein